MPTPESFDDLIRREIEPWLTLSESQLTQLRLNYELLVRWNAKMNLTTVKPGREMIIRHYCESLLFGLNIAADPDVPVSLIDVGSGAGFPGVPVAVLRPSWKVILVESNLRKCVFLREATRHLKNVEVASTRIEQVHVPADWLISRAVNPEQVLANMPRGGRKVGLMLSADDFSRLRSYPGIAWSDPVQVPWGDRRLCVYGTFHVEPSE